uniref:Uncharacterized protein n=1 Tax=Nelumbo nucifera TaxID=4432 RepID=A0A822XQY6_NELNU|nr:TPA_asm: hypothetical protein HUJ06_023905 [Nelumbo nucifera]
MGTPPAEVLLKKIQELETGHAHLKKEMSKLILSTTGGTDSKMDHGHQRSHSVLAERSRLAASRRKSGSGCKGGASWKKGSSSFRHSLLLQRENKSHGVLNLGQGGGPAAAKFSDKLYLNILQFMG